MPSIFCRSSDFSCCGLESSCGNRQLLGQLNSWACLVGCVIAEGMRGGMEGPDMSCHRQQSQWGQCLGFQCFSDLCESHLLDSEAWHSPDPRSLIFYPLWGGNNVHSLWTKKKGWITVYGPERKDGSCTRLEFSGKGLLYPSLLRQSRTPL